MDDVNWEYEAPRFVDFEANEHLRDNADDYFDRAHESSAFPEDFGGQIEDEEFHLAPQPEEKPAHSVRFEEDAETNPVANPEDALSSFPQTPNRETYGVKTPSRVLRSSVKKQKLRCSTPGVSTDGPIPCGDLSQIESSKPEKSGPKIISNIITPSRFKTWKTGATSFTMGSNEPKTTKQQTPMQRLAKAVASSNSQAAESSAPPAKKMKKAVSKVHLTAPSSLIPHSHTKKHARQLTSEERELAKIKKMREDAKQVKKSREGLVKKLEKQGTSNMSAVSNKSHVTKTQEFHFMTDERIAKTHSMQTRSDAETHSDFQSDLRKYAPSPAKKARTTKVQPFNLTTTKRKHEEYRPEDQTERRPYIPIAKAIMDFHKRTPQRFHFNKAKVAPRATKPLKATIPKTPNITKSKPRVPAFPSAQEKEEMELEEMKKNQFKARPISSEILDAPAPLRKVEKKAPTVPEEFHLSTGVHSSHASVQPQAEKPKPFKAQPVPASVFEKPNEKRKQSIEVTVPQSPAFALKNRLKAKVVPDTSEVQSQPRFYHPPPQHSNVFKPKLTSASTEPEPFSFDAKDHERFSKKEEKIKEILEKETAPATFKAQRKPSFKSPSASLPRKEAKPATRAEPFQLSCDNRAALRVHEWEKQVEEEVRDMREKARFKANEDYRKITQGKPWQPRLDNRPPTEPLNVVLRSELRAKEREQYEKRCQEMLKEKENVLQEDKAEQDEKEKQEMMALRKSMVHKAQDVHKYKGVQVKKSSKTLTVPASPKFSTRFNK